MVSELKNDVTIQSEVGYYEEFVTNAKYTFSVSTIFIECLTVKHLRLHRQIVFIHKKIVVYRI